MLLRLLWPWNRIQWLALALVPPVSQWIWCTVIIVIIINNINKIFLQRNWIKKVLNIYLDIWSCLVFMCLVLHVKLGGFGGGLGNWNNWMLSLRWWPTLSVVHSHHQVTGCKVSQDDTSPICNRECSSHYVYILFSLASVVALLQWFLCSEQIQCCITIVNKQMEYFTLNDWCKLVAIASAGVWTDWSNRASKTKNMLLAAESWDHFCHWFDLTFHFEKICGMGKLFLMLEHFYEVLEADNV